MFLTLAVNMTESDKRKSEGRMRRLGNSERIRWMAAQYGLKEDAWDLLLARR